MSRESCKGYSYDVWHNMEWLTMQASPFVWILFDKLVDSVLVRKYTLVHGTRVWLPCYQEPTNCSCPDTDWSIQQHSLIYYKIQWIINFFPSIFLAVFRMRFLTLSYISCTRPNHRLLSCLPTGKLWTDIFCYIYIGIVLKSENNFPESKNDIFPNCQTHYGVLWICLRVDVFKTLQKFAKIFE